MRVQAADRQAVLQADLVDPEEGGVVQRCGGIIEIQHLGGNEEHVSIHHGERFRILSFPVVFRPAFGQIVAREQVMPFVRDTFRADGPHDGLAEIAVCIEIEGPSAPLQVQMEAERSGREGTVAENFLALEDGGTFVVDSSVGIQPLRVERVSEADIPVRKKIIDVARIG